ncbi:rod shape-determining protein MreD [Changchengzhania lutea]|uniref:rod shape-determining protein MreD n=1 Tax=Changchengzhania lutea TaxID=2049305 RepID=UPI00115ED93E|nr:rod shape-determining protein MreD [Changchengzhania lutea]
MNNIISIHTIRFFFLLLFQVLIFNHINFLGYINPYIYILFIILFPIKNDRSTFLILSFLLGLAIDMFQDSGGMHAAASVSIAYARPVILRFAFGVQYENQTVKFHNLEFGSKLTYFTILTLLHHLVLFSLEIFNMSRIILVLQKTLFSGIFTILLCILLTTIFSKKKR